MTERGLNFSSINAQNTATSILDASIPIKAYCKINLSIHNTDLDTIAISNPKACQTYIDKVLKENNARVAYGGYLEQRNLYASSSRFSKGTIRDIHLGLDFWCKAGTKVVTPLHGKVHSFNNNKDVGNYGPTIILHHKIAELSFYTLYGHLSLQSLQGLFVGKEFKKGATLATLGETAINVNYAPHLHFQLIQNLQDFSGDYPGVCHSNDLVFYKKNCPDPNHLLKL